MVLRHFLPEGRKGGMVYMAVLHDVSALFYSILYSIAASVCIDICYTFGREKVDVVDEI